MHFDAFSFGSVEIDDITYDYDVVIDCGKVRKRKKQPSKKFREEYGHTAIFKGRDSLEVPPAGGGYRGVRPPTGDERRKA